MTNRVQLGWRIPESVWDSFIEYVEEKHSCEGVYVRFELESAMREYLDKDGVLEEAESLLREHTELRGLSSSKSQAVATNRYQGETRLVTHRVRDDLKEAFKKFADKHDAKSYGRLMAAALDSYADGGRARRILEDVKRVITGATSSGSTENSVENVVSTESESGSSGATSSGSTEESIENVVSTGSESGSSGATSSGSTEESVESTLSTASGSATNGGSSDPDPNVVLEAADALLDELNADDSSDIELFPRVVLDNAIERAVGGIDDETVEMYHDPVLEQIGASPHPHKSGVYMTDWYREEVLLWKDMDKSERTVLLRRWAVGQAIEHSNQRHALSYNDVIEIFEEYCGGGGPSHQYAYDLMEAAADEAGFKYGKFSVGTTTPKLQLRIDVSEVDKSMIDWCRDELYLDPEQIEKIADIESYAASQPSDQRQGAEADD